jgi:uncharacterized hydantoinase/oxoprolinase family protein
MMQQMDQSVTVSMEHCRRLARVITATRDMLSLAEQGHWQQVSDLEQRRRQDLVECFSESVAQVDSELVAEALATLLHLNEELMSRLRVDRAEVVARSREYTQGRSAVAGYRAVEASS